MTYYVLFVIDAAVAQAIHEIAQIEQFTDIVVTIEFATRIQREGAPLDHCGGERNVRGADMPKRGDPDSPCEIGYAGVATVDGATLAKQAAAPTQRGW